MNNDYLRDYRTLQVRPGCSLQSLKAARRRLITAWHPDRFANDDKHQAEERIKEINTAFDRLIEYHQLVGVLPTPAITEPAPPPPGDGASVGPPPATATVASTGGFPSSRAGPLSRSRRFYRLLPWAMLVLAAALSTEVVRTMLPRSPEPASDIPVVAAPDAEVTALAPFLAARGSSAEYFTVGSSLGEVYAIQGIPSATENGMWRYGKSTVYFADGAVIAWEHDPANPLRAAPPDHMTRHEPPTFALGSTKAEVRAVQGAPLIETESLWDYGLSKVYFRDGRVIGWDTSPMHPLKARK